MLARENIIKVRYLTIVAIVITIGIGAFKFFNTQDVQMTNDNLDVAFTNEDIAAELTEQQEVSKKEYSDLYQEKIQINGASIKLVVKQVTLHSEDNGDWLFGEYRFYSTDDSLRLLAEIGSLIPPEYDSGTGIDPHFSIKDVTGDNIPEIFVMVEQNGHSNRWYGILQWQDGFLQKIRVAEARDEWVGFDTIEYRDGYIYITNHGSDSHTKTAYRLNEYTLVPTRSIRFKWDNKTQDENDCEIAEIDRVGNIIEMLENKKDCNIWTDSFDQYFNSLYFQF